MSSLSMLSVILLAALADAKPHPQGRHGAGHPHYSLPQPSVTSTLVQNGIYPITTPATSLLEVNNPAGVGSVTSLYGSVTPISGGINSGPTSVQSTSPQPSGGNTGGSPSPAGLPSGCFTINGIGVGWDSDDDPATLARSISSSAGPCTYGHFAQMTSGTTMPDTEIQSGAAAAAGAKAIYVISLKTGSVDFAQVSADAVAKSMSALSSMMGGGEVWLRLAHEMNWYSQTGEYVGTSDSFKTMWQGVAGKVDRSKVKMYWCPNPPSSTGDSVQTLNQKWYPGDESVDVVGLDAYGQGTNPTFQDSVPDAFCSQYGDKMVHLGEAGWLGGGTSDQKAEWLGQVSGVAAKQGCPNYAGFMWFEYNKPGGGDANGDYTVASGSGSGIAAQVLG